MNHTPTEEIFCSYFEKKKTALDRAPMPGEIGQLILKHASQDAWSLWLLEQTKFLNEYRLNPLEPPHRDKIRAHMKVFLKLPKD